ncbi:MAG: BamA/TamA family outer membrane protein [Polyangiaceae bacterium]|nr:BamA/TamA family outer membrane protein [Polyangiaceae bacterium]
MRLSACLCVLVQSLWLTTTPVADARENGAEVLGAVPQLDPAPDTNDLVGRPITSIELYAHDTRWQHEESLRRVRVGELFTPELARRAIKELLESGRYADAQAMAEAEPTGGVRLRLLLVPRRIVGQVQLTGVAFARADVLRAAGVDAGTDITPAGLDSVSEKLANWYAERGYPSAKVDVQPIETDDPMQVVIRIDVVAGEPARVHASRFMVEPYPALPVLVDLLREYRVQPGDRADRWTLSAADKDLAGLLRKRGWYDAQVSHSVRWLEASRAELSVTCLAGPRYQIEFEGAEHFDAGMLLAGLELETAIDRRPDTLGAQVKRYYLERGFLDARVRVVTRPSGNGTVRTLVFVINEGAPVRIAAREYPCLSNNSGDVDVSGEIDGILSEQLPGSGLFGPVDSKELSELIGPRQATGARATPFEPNPYATYVPQVIDRAMKHLQSLYRSEGFLSAQVGPALLVRRRCHPLSPPNQCAPIGPRSLPPVSCPVDEHGVPTTESPTGLGSACVADPDHGVTCEPEGVLRIPIRVGPLTRLYALAFEGNQAFVDKKLRQLSGLEMGAPATPAELETARRNILEAYQDQGYAFAAVEQTLELSPDHTRARARFTISEREQVTVSRIVVQGAERTNESLVRRRVTLEIGQPYRSSQVRDTEERLATLGVFSSVTVSLEDPYVPARRKVVLVHVVERPSQYLDVRPGFSTGEGFRIAFEYGHRNLAAEAIALTLRVQLGYLPSGLILERDVRSKYDSLRPDLRLERRNSAGIVFPEIGLGPLFPFSVEGIDVRDNARDYGLTKDAGIVTLSYRPTRRFTAQVGASLERNDARIFGTDQKGALEQYVSEHRGVANLFRVPEGTSLAVAERIGINWDRRNNPLGATKGTLVSAGIEHVRATPVGANAQQQQEPGAAPGLFDATTSEFLRFTQRMAGYLPIGRHGLAFAASFAWGLNHQLFATSLTYPDRLFFLGGVDSIRGFLQDSLVPEDVAQKLLDPNSGLTLAQVVIRGGDVFLNPRAELRVPMYGSLQTALFLDAGNLWTDPTQVRPLSLRYSVGTGLRLGTPVGPLALDYGFNVDHVLDRFLPNRTHRRFWEDLGAFHFSIGLF